VKVGYREFSFAPGVRIKGGDFAWDIGTAGSTTMLVLSMLPLVCFADRPVTARITGGVFQDFAPSPHHMQHVLPDQLVLFAALADGTSRYRVPFQTAHLASNLWIVSLFGVQTSFQGSQVTIQGLGFRRQHASP
jgi:RNA 3'-terminal phosphate cyclase